MKHAIIIADGGADFPLAELGGKTPFEAARTPNLDALARVGRVGRAVTTPPGFAAGSDVCSMCLLGYDPRSYHTGRAPLEAAALGLNLGPKDWIFRVNLVTVGEPGTPDDGLMLDHSAGAITNAEARELFKDLFDHWRRTLGPSPFMDDLSLVHGVSYRGILVDSMRSDFARGLPRDYAGTKTTPPHEILGQPWEGHDPQAAMGCSDSGEVSLQSLMYQSRQFLPTHPVNVARKAAGKRPANMAWIWGQGVKPDMPSFQERFGLRGAMTTAVDLLAGISALIGWKRLDVPGATSYHDNDYAGQGRATCEALGDFDIVCCHVEAPDEASHQGDWKTKVAAIEAIDRHVVGPVAARLQQDKDWRLLYLPDHFTLVSTRKHDATPVPFLIAGAGVQPASQLYSERAGAQSDICIDPGDRLMEYFLR